MHLAESEGGAAVFGQECEICEICGAAVIDLDDAGAGAGGGGRVVCGPCRGHLGRQDNARQDKQDKQDKQAPEGTDRTVHGRISEREIVDAAAEESELLGEFASTIWKLRADVAAADGDHDRAEVSRRLVRWIEEIQDESVPEGVRVS